MMVIDRELDSRRFLGYRRSLVSEGKRMGRDLRKIRQREKKHKGRNASFKSNLAQCDEYQSEVKLKLKFKIHFNLLSLLATQTDCGQCWCTCRALQQVAL